jgi:hypothetical protein
MSYVLVLILTASGTITTIEGFGSETACQWAARRFQEQARPTQAQALCVTKS